MALRKLIVRRIRKRVKKKRDRFLAVLRGGMAPPDPWPRAGHRQRRRVPIRIPKIIPIEPEIKGWSFIEFLKSLWLILTGRKRYES